MTLRVPKLDKALQTMGKNPPKGYKEITVELSVDRGSLMLRHDRPTHTLLHVSALIRTEPLENPALLPLRLLRRALNNKEATIDLGTRVAVESLGRRTEIEPLENSTQPIPEPSDAPEPCTEPVADVARPLARVLPAADADSFREHLHAVYFDDDMCVATDGHRMHQADLPFPTDGFLIPRAGVMALLNVLKAHKGTCTWWTYRDSVRVVAGPWMVIIPILRDVRFPPYKKVIPEGAPFIMEPNFQDLKDALKTIPKDDIVTLSLVDGVLAIQHEDSTCSVSLTDKGRQETFKVSVNVTYLKDALQPGARFLSRGEPEDAVIINHDFGMAVIMPVRV